MTPDWAIERDDGGVSFPRSTSTPPEVALVIKGYCRAVDQIGVVRNHRDIRVDHRVVPPAPRHAPRQLQCRAGRSDLVVVAAELCSTAGIDNQPSSRIPRSSAGSHSPSRCRRAGE
jgi:hypothetical protein